MDKNGGKLPPDYPFFIGGVIMSDSYKSSLSKALDNYFNLLSGATRNDSKKKAIIKNIKKRGKKNDTKRH